MDDHLDYSVNSLEHCSYRSLQQMAKSMNLPSNVKKVQLIEMINAKKYSTPAEVDRIVERVKRQRQHLTQAKKRSRRTYIPRYTSESESMSPPISITPKRPVVVKCSDVSLRQVIIRSQNSLLRPTRPASDRVLRSFRPVQRQYMNQVVMERTVDQGTQMSSMKFIRKYKPTILSNIKISRERQVVPVSQMPPSHVLVKRPRLLSGIYPINKDVNFQVQSVEVRNREGKMSKINALVHKPSTEERANSQPVFINNARKNLETTIQDIINGNVDAQNLQKLNYPNTSGVTEPEYPRCSVYYQRVRTEPSEPLPRINDAFGQFRTKDVTPPLFVHVDQEYQNNRISYPPACKPTTGLLETLFNFRSQFLIHQPLEPVTTTANTRCVYSVPTVTTAVLHKPTVSYTEPYMASGSKLCVKASYAQRWDDRLTVCVAYEPGDQCQYSNIDSTRADIRVADYDFPNEEVHTSGSSLGTHSQELGANVTISDMVEDALEIISQDGDYMERMGMDVRMQCVLCNWAGPKIILEYHIRKEHADEIVNQEKRDWHITYSLGILVAAPLWTCRVIQHDSALFVLSVKYRPDCFMATLSSLSMEPEAPTGSITIFNKVTGEPHAWAGEIRELPPTLPYDTRPALALRLRDMNLLPNSANVDFVNGELVLQSPSKVVFRQDLNDIHITLFVKIFT